MSRATAIAAVIVIETTRSATALIPMSLCGVECAWVSLPVWRRRRCRRISYDRIAGTRVTLCGEIYVTALATRLSLSVFSTHISRSIPASEALTASSATTASSRETTAHGAPLAST